LTRQGRFRRHAGPLALPAIAGAVAATGQPPLAFWPLTLAGFAAAAFLLTRAQTTGAAARLGWATGVGYFAASLFWIVNPFLVEADIYGWMAPFAVVAMAAGLALFWAAGFAAAHRVAAAPGWRALALPVALTLAELLRGHVLTGFPWGLPAYAFADTPLRALTAFIGPYGLTLAVLAVAALPFAWRRGRGAVAALAVLGLLWGAGMLRLAQPIPPVETTVTLRLVQPNAPQDQKWDPDWSPVFFGRLLDLTAAPGNPDLVIWPETAVTFWLGEEPELQRLITDAAGGDRRVILGARRAEGARFYNTLAVLGPEGGVEQLYDKALLVPFGEYMPLGDLLARYGVHGLAAGEGAGFSAGPGAVALDLGPAGRAQPLICYEDIFPAFTLSGAARPDWLLHITNDAWFGLLAGPQQHFVQARFRATEAGLPLVRVANTGISAVIDAQGRVLNSLPLGTDGLIDATLPGRLPPTPYSRTGDLPLALLLLAGLALAGLRRRR
jgi:apolipoprotein N-acyltransferase